MAERHGLQLYMLALDYSKAFDSIPHAKLVESLRRLGAPPHMTRLVEMLYVSPRFRIKIQEGISDEYEQKIGIRQGCPLSPYLYIIATSCLMTDVLKVYRDRSLLPSCFSCLLHDFVLCLICYVLPPMLFRLLLLLFWLQYFSMESLAKTGVKEVSLRPIRCAQKGGALRMANSSRTGKSRSGT